MIDKILVDDLDSKLVAVNAIANQITNSGTKTVKEVLEYIAIYKESLTLRVNDIKGKGNE